MSYLDKQGVNKLWNKCKAKFASFDEYGDLTVPGAINVDSSIFVGDESEINGTLHVNGGVNSYGSPCITPDMVYKHTIRAFSASAPVSLVVFEVLTLSNTPLTKATLYENFPNVEILASGYYSNATSASYKVVSITPKNSTNIMFYYGSGSSASNTYGATYFTDDVSPAIKQG